MGKNISDLKEQARAPYNFIQLNDVIVPSKINEYVEKEQLKNNKLNYWNKNDKKAQKTKQIFRSAERASGSRLRSSRLQRGGRIPRAQRPQPKELLLVLPKTRAGI